MPLARRVTTIVLALSLSGAVVPMSAVANEQESAASAGALADRYIVQTVSPAASRALAHLAGISPDRISNVYASALTGFAAKLDRSQLALLEAQPSVVSVTPDAPTRAAAVQPTPPWGLDRIDQRETAGDGEYAYDTSGEGVTVFVADTGARFSHEQFGGRATSGHDFVDADEDASDCNGHGTHVSGTIAGSTFGVAKAASIVSLRVWDCDGSGWMSDMIAALDWAVAHKPAGPAVVNMSGGGGVSDPMDAAVARTVQAGIPVVVAAGNDSRDACLTSPARAPEAITVGATDSADTRAPFSNFGSCVDVFAPGVGILSAIHFADASTSTLSGTSMAAPHVTGIVARYLGATPSATAQAAAAVVGAATRDTVVNSNGSPNLLAYVEPPASLPGAPTAVWARKRDGAASATLFWSPPASTDGSPITGYLVSRDGTDSSGTGAWSTIVPATTRSQTFTKLVPGSMYTLTVKAMTASGTGPGASATGRTSALPGAPVIGDAGSGVTTDTSVSITANWEPPVDGGIVRRYTVTAVSQSTGAAKTVTVRPTTLSTPVIGLASGDTYRVHVVATNGSGTGAVSAPSNVVTAH